jgi:hypothetical protein
MLDTCETPGHVGHKYQSNAAEAANPSLGIQAVNWPENVARTVLQELIWKIKTSE